MTKPNYARHRGLFYSSNSSTNAYLCKLLNMFVCFSQCSTYHIQNHRPTRTTRTSSATTSATKTTESFNPNNLQLSNPHYHLSNLSAVGSSSFDSVVTNKPTNLPRPNFHPLTPFRKLPSSAPSVTPPLPLTSPAPHCPADPNKQFHPIHNPQLLLKTFPKLFQITPHPSLRVPRPHYTPDSLLLHHPQRPTMSNQEDVRSSAHHRPFLLTPDTR